MAEQRYRKPQVVGSSPTLGSKIIYYLAVVNLELKHVLKTFKN